MKDILISLLWTAIASVVLTTNYHISFKPLKFSVEHFNWGYTIGLFLIMVGFFLSVGYARHLGKKDSGYFDGYKDATNDAIELFENKYGKKP